MVGGVGGVLGMVRGGWGGVNGGGVGRNSAVG